MKMITRGAALTLAAVLMTGTAAFAAENLVPVRATLEEKGFEIGWNQETMSVVIRDGGFVVEEKVGEKISLDYDVTYAEESFFEEVDAMKAAYEEYSTKATVTEVGEGYFLADTEKLGEVIFMADDNTFFRHEMNRRLYRFDDVQVGNVLKVYFSEAMTLSLPPQTYAKEVVFLNEEVKAENVTTTGKVLSVNTEESFFTVEKEDGSRVRFNVSEETFFHHVMNRMLYRLESLEEGMEVDVIHSDAMTFSLPPQAGAIEVIIK
ncbi:MAG: hypothetical protein IKU60_05695 [Clostridia bacterium]|nr:hypothetical protein [Clostridia bacterium]